MCDWDEWVVEWLAWVNCFSGKVAAPAVEIRPRLKEDWGDRVPEFMDLEL